jgi:hypothetical protein
MEMKENMTDQLLDAAACDALGAHSPMDSAAYRQQIAALEGTAADAARATDRELRETTARLAAASPHLAPPPELRGRILQATAPATFRMEDYRQATREDFRYYKWGFYAAACFLIAGALYNIQTRNTFSAALQQANNTNIALNNQNKQITAQAQQLALAAQQRNDALRAFVNPQGIQITWKDETTGLPVGRGVIDMSTHKALLIFPEETIASGTHPQLTLNVNGQTIPFQTAVLTAPASQLNLAISGTGPKINVANILNVQKITPDDTNKPVIAGN